MDSSKEMFTIDIINITNNTHTITSEESKGIIVDILGLPHEYLHTIWWNMLEKIYNIRQYNHMHKVIVEKDEQDLFLFPNLEDYKQLNFSNKMDNLNVLTESQRLYEKEKELYSVLKSVLLSFNTWGIFIHYLCYDGSKNIFTNHSFEDHLDSIDMVNFLKISNYIPQCRFFYLDAFIINEFVNKKKINHFTSYEEYDNGKVTLVCNDLFTNDNYTTIKMIKHLLYEIGYEEEIIDKIVHIKIVVSPSFIADLSSLFISTDTNKNVLAKILCKNAYFLSKLKSLYSFLKENMNHHFALKNVFNFMNDYGFVFLSHRLFNDINV